MASPAGAGRQGAELQPPTALLPRGADGDRAAASAAARGRASRSDVRIGEELSSYTVDVTSALAFGHDLNTLEHRENELQRHIQRVFSDGHVGAAATP